MSFMEFCVMIWLSSPVILLVGLLWQMYWEERDRRIEEAEE